LVGRAQPPLDGAVDDIQHIGEHAVDGQHGLRRKEERHGRDPGDRNTPAISISGVNSSCAMYRASIAADAPPGLAVANLA